VGRRSRIPQDEEVIHGPELRPRSRGHVRADLLECAADQRLNNIPHTTTARELLQINASMADQRGVDRSADREEPAFPGQVGMRRRSPHVVCAGRVRVAVENERRLLDAAALPATFAGAGCPQTR
jgi:hypothetical protein